METQYYHLSKSLFENNSECVLNAENVRIALFFVKNEGNSFNYTGLDLLITGIQIMFVICSVVFQVAKVPHFVCTLSDHVN